MNCNEIAARRGWDLFSSAVPVPTLDQINESLTAAGLGAVSNRMYRHYKVLLHHGYAEYMPINELDVRVKFARLREAG
jgi:hypothetical protein